MTVSERGHKNIVTALLEAGADVNAADRYGQTPVRRQVCITFFALKRHPRDVDDGSRPCMYNNDGDG